jgi:hypothetical protein
MNDSRPPKPDEPEPEETWRRFVPRSTPWQFRLRALLLFVLVASIGLSLLAIFQKLHATIGGNMAYMDSCCRNGVRPVEPAERPAACPKFPTNSQHILELML